MCLAMRDVTQHSQWMCHDERCQDLRWRSPYLQYIGPRDIASLAPKVTFSPLRYTCKERPHNFLIASSNEVYRASSYAPSVIKILLRYAMRASILVKRRTKTGNTIESEVRSGDGPAKHLKSIRTKQLRDVSSIGGNGRFSGVGLKIVS